MRFALRLNDPIVALALVLATLGQAEARNAAGAGVETGLSSQGIYVGPTYALSPDLDLRSPLYIGSLAGGVDANGASLAGSVQSRSLAVMADLHPWGGGFRVSGGLAYGGYSLKGTLSSVTLEGNTYTGTFDVNLSQQQNIAPVVSIGYAKTFSSGWSFVGEVGGKFVRYKLTAVPSSSLGSAQSQFDADLASVNATLRAYNVTPFVTLGVGFRF